MSEFKIPEGFNFFEEFDGMDMGEIEEVEDLTGIPFTRMGRPGFEPPMKLIRAVVWIVLRREDPSVTFDQLRSLKMAEMNKAADGETELDPQS